MRSFNVTCAVSKSIIGCGDEVKIFFIAPNRFENFSMENMDNKLNDTTGLFSFCSTMESCAIYGIPVTGIYDDYGNFAIQQNDESEFMLKFLNSILVEEEEPLKDYDQLQERMTEQEVFIKGIGNKLRLSIMAVHAEIYKFANRQEHLEYWDCGRALGYEERRKKIVEESTLFSIRGGLSGLARSLYLKSKNEGVELTEDEIEIVDKYMIDDEGESKCPFDEFYEPIPHEQHIGGMWVDLYDLVGDRFYDLIVDMHSFLRFLSKSNIGIVPSKYGSQSECHDVHAGYLRGMADIVEAMHIEHGEE